MVRVRVVVLFAVVLAGGLRMCQADSSMIGLATARGGFRLDSAPVNGNATLFEGARLETGVVSSRVRLDSGARVELGSQSRGVFYRNRLVLEAGTGRLESGDRFSIEARALRIQPTAPESRAHVTMAGGGSVEVAALEGTLRVLNAGGAVVANMAAGEALVFEQAGGASAAFRMTGCLQKKNGHYLLTDQVAGVTEELRGDGLEQEVGNTVEITATTVPNTKAIEGASEVIQVTRIRRLTTRCAVAQSTVGAPAGAASGAASGNTADAAAGARMTKATKVVIAGVVVGGAGAATAIILARDEEQKDTISR